MKHKTRYNLLGHFIILHVYQEGINKIDVRKVTNKFNANNDSRKKWLRLFQGLQYYTTQNFHYRFLQ